MSDRSLSNPNPDELRIAVIDDDESFRDSCIDVIHYYGKDFLRRPCVARGVGTWRDFDRLVRTDGFLPDIVLLDNNFELSPDGSTENVKNQGIDVYAGRVATWRERGRLPRTCEIILVTAGDYQSPGKPKFLEIGYQAALVGIADVLPKPLDKGPLFASIDRILKRTKSEEGVR